jgi:hypothetical protein
VKALPTSQHGPGQEDETFLRALVFPEEDRHLFTTVAWRGEFRWFRSPNVVPLERYRELKWWGQRDAR